MPGSIRRCWIVAVAALWLMVPGAAMATCSGDCSGDGQVTIDEILLEIEIALGSEPAGSCDGSGSGEGGRTTVDDVVVAVNHATGSCEPVATTPTATPTVTPTPPPCESNGSAAVFASSATPANGTGELLESCVTAENAGGSRDDLTRVSARGTVNGIDFLLQVYFVTATGQVDTVSYGWMPFPGIPDFFDNLAFCNTPACVGVTINLATKIIRFRNTALASEGGQSAVLNGSITLDALPTPMATPTPTPCPGGSLTLNFSEVQGTNTSQPLPASLILGTAMNFSRAADPPVFAYLSALYDGCPMPFPRLTLGFQFSGAPIQAGTVYPVGSSQGQLNQIEFREEGFSNFKSWEAQSGSLIVDSVDASHVTLRIVDAHMRPRFIDTQGTFVINAAGSLTTP